MVELLKQSISIIRPVNRQGKNMGVKTTEETVYSDVPASVQPATGKVQEYYAQRQVLITKSIFVVADAVTVERGDIVTDGTSRYAVEGWRDLAGWGAVLAIDVVEETP